METLSLFFGYAGTAAAVICYQVRSRKGILLFQVITNLLVAISYILLGPARMAGVAINALAALHAYFNLRFEERNRRTPTPLTAVFLCLYAASALLPWLTGGVFCFPFDLFPFVCASLFTVGITSQNPSFSRCCFLLNGAVWIVYDALAPSFAMANLITHILVFLSSLVALFRFVILKKSA